MKDLGTQLDEQLESPAQQATAQWLKQLPADEVSMTWRAQLNERILAAAPPVRKRRFGPVWRAGLSLGLAATLGIIYFARPHTSDRPLAPSSVEATLITAHQSTVARAEAGTGVLESSTESTDTYQYNESDLDTL